jgi:hypothetical protein
MNQPVQGNQRQEQGIVVIYLMDSDSSDEEPDSEEEPAERQPHPAGPVHEPLEDTQLPHRNRQDFWEHAEQPSRLFEDPDPLPEPPVKCPQPKPSIPGQSTLSDDVYVAFESMDPYWLERKYNPKRRCYREIRNSAQSTAEE